MINIFPVEGISSALWRTNYSNEMFNLSVMIPSRTVLFEGFLRPQTDTTLQYWLDTHSKI